MSFSTQVLLALCLGCLSGITFGEYCGKLELLGTVFIGLLRMTVLPYVIVSLIANLGKLSKQQSRRLALVGGLVLIALWAVALFTVYALSNTFPEWKSGSFFSSALTEPPSSVDFVDVFIPANIFESLAENHVPAVILLSISVGLALSGMANRKAVIPQLDVIASALVRVSSFVVRLAPIGVFAMAASASGTISWDEFGRLQAYLVTYVSGAFLLGFVALPLLVTCCTDLRYSEVIALSKDAMITAFATGKLIIVLPLLIEQTEKLFEKQAIEDSHESAPAVDVLYPVAYAFPHVGKLLAILFVPFTAWFIGDALQWQEFPLLLSAGTLSSFGGPLLSIPFLLDYARLPHDMFQLFLLSGVVGEKFGDALGVMHLVGFTLIATHAFLGRLRIELGSLLRYLALTTLFGITTVCVLRLGLTHTLQFVEGRDEIITNMQLLEEPVPHKVERLAAANPDPLLGDETLLERIQRRGIIRVGFNEDKLPFAYFNTHDELVGFDINMAHALARDLGVTIEFVRFDRSSLVQQLDEDAFDVVMSGLVGTLERSQSMQHTTAYLDVNLGLVVPDYRAREFRSIKQLRSLPGLRIGFVDLSRGLVERMQRSLPNAELVELRTNGAYFDQEWKQLDALLISAESGSAFTLFYPEFEVVIPDELQVALPLFYAVAARDGEMTDFLEHWVSLRRKDGTMDEYYNHWILGETAKGDQPRWCLIRDVFHWVE
ncbi:MAG: cation:dicarboxylase symporter family transporter [Planctomycetota bacterium]